MNSRLQKQIDDAAEVADPPQASASWMKAVLWAAAVYNVVWGSAVILFPTATLELMHFPPQPTPQLWQCIGMIVGVYGVGYGLAAGDPCRLWPLVFVGLLGKILGPLGFLDAALHGLLPWSAGWTIVMNDMIWWFPFGLILIRAWRSNRRNLSNSSLTPAQSGSLDAVDHVAIAVADVGDTVDWYQARFRCRIAYRDDTWALIEFANMQLAFVISEQHPPHLAFRHAHPESYSPLKQHRDGTRSCYIKDPAGNAVELMAPSPPLPTHLRQKSPPRANGRPRSTFE